MNLKNNRIEKEIQENKTEREYIREEFEHKIIKLDNK